MTHQRQTQPTSFRVVNQGIAHPIELLENFLLLLVRDSDSLVYHFQLYRSVIAIEIYTDKFSILRVLESVVDQVQEGTSHSLAVDAHWRYFVNLLFELESTLFQLVAIRVERVVHQFAHVSFAKVVFLAAGFDAGEIEDVVDQASQ